MSNFKLNKLYPKVGNNNKSNRDLWLKKTLEGISKGSKILDAGAGELQYKKYCNHLEYVAQDFGQYDGKGDFTGLQTEKWDNSKLDIVSDITEIPVADSSFDVIMCIEVFEHIPNPIRALEEFSRILKEKGVLILTAPVSSLTHFAPYYFYNGFSQYFYEHHLKKNGFDIEEITYNGNWFEYLAQELNRLPYMLEKYSYFKYPILWKVFLKTFFIPLQFTLSIASSYDVGSNKLHSFGIHIKAKKIESNLQK